MNKDKLINYTVPKIVWGMMCAGCLIGVFFYGAWWHLFTAGVCALMSAMHTKDDYKPTNNTDNGQDRKETA